MNDGDLAADVVLRDGSTVAVRPVVPADEPLLRRFFASLEERSLAFRFFTGAPNLDAAARILADVDGHRRFGLLALRGPERRVVGHGFLAAIDDAHAEVAFAVADELQGHGLGTILLAHLAEHAAEEGFTTLVADVMPENHAMVRMFRASGLPVEVRAEPEAVVVEMPASPAPEAIARFQERDAIAARAAVAALFDPAAVAWIDAPPAAATAQARELAAAGARALVVGGGSAWGGPRSEAERGLLAACRALGVRLVGPGSLGVLDNRPDRELDLTGIPEPPPPGRIGIVTQAEPAGRELLAAAARLGIGVSTFVSLGDRADLTANDLLEYWEGDPETAVTLLQVESFSDPRRFARVARRTGAAMPIVVLAERGAGDSPGRGLFEAVGATRAETAEEALTLAAALVDEPVAAAARPAAAHPPWIPWTRPDEAAGILATALAEAAPELDRVTGARLLDCYGIGTEPSGDAPVVARLRVAVEVDPLFGPVLRCGPPGAPRATMPARLCPLDEEDVPRLLEAAALPGLTTLAPAGRAQLELALEAVSTAAADHAEIESIELEPLFVGPTGTFARSTRIRVRRPPERRPWPRTWE